MQPPSGPKSPLSPKAASPTVPVPRDVVPMDVVLLYDASGSASDADFVQAKEAGSVLMMMFEDDAQIAFGQFGDVFQLECPLTTDRFEHQTKHKHTKKVKGAAKAANLEAALDEVAKIFQESGRPGANKVLFLLSVGVFAQSTDALLQTVQSHKSKNTAIIGVGIGKHDHSSMSKICSAENFYAESNLQNVMDLVPSLELRHK